MSFFVVAPVLRDTHITISLPLRFRNQQDEGLERDDPLPQTAQRGFEEGSTCAREGVQGIFLGDVREYELYEFGDLECGMHYLGVRL